MSDTEKAQALLDQYGYLVLGSMYELRSGHVVNGATTRAGVFSHPTVVIGPSSRADFEAQSRYLKTAPRSRIHPYYYKVVAE